MNEYKIYYYFSGKGEVTIKAKTRSEAVDKFNYGEFDKDKDIDKSEDYEIDEVKMISLNK